MASLLAHLHAFVVRRFVRPRLGRMEDLAAVRAIFESPTFSDPKGVLYEPGSLGGIPGEWVRPAVPKHGWPEYRVLYVHGGGFIACSAKVYRPVTGSLARRGLTLFVPDYRLAPEHPFPAALEDVVAAWTALAERGPAGLAGDSAGGNLSLALMLEARARGLPMPIAAALFSPATDLVGTGPSLIENANRDAMFDPEGLRSLLPAYLAGADPLDPRASPLHADLTGLAPMILHVGESEVLRDDTLRLAERAAAANVPVVATVFPVVAHAWQFAGYRLPESRRSLNAAAGFLRAHLDGRHSGPPERSA